MLYPIELLGLTGGSMLAMIDQFVMRERRFIVSCTCIEPNQPSFLSMRLT